jgi:hypothetical protein
MAEKESEGELVNLEQGTSLSTVRRWNGLTYRRAGGSHSENESNLGDEAQLHGNDPVSPLAIVTSSEFALERSVRWDRLAPLET